MNTRQQFLQVSYNGRKLLEQHSLTDIGIWHIQGEDPNCDFGGSHYQPSLGYFEGTLDDIIDLAVVLPKFWNWGAGGSITKINVQTPATALLILATIEHKQKLIDELAVLNETLSGEHK